MLVSVLEAGYQFWSVLVAVGRIAYSRPIDDKERLSFLTSLADKVDKPESQDAYVYALADVANAKLRLPDLDGAQKDLATCQKVLDSFDSVETVVHASFYKVNADYYHVRLWSLDGKKRTRMNILTCFTAQGRIRLLLQERPPLPCLH